LNREEYTEEFTFTKEVAMRFIAPLSLDTKRLLERIRKSSRHAQTRDRAHAILLSAQRFTVTQIMKIFHVTRITVYRWLDAWEEWAIIGLYDNPGRGRKVKLTWAEQYCVKIWGKMFPRQLERVKGLIAHWFGKVVCTKTVARILKAHRMRWRRVRRRPKKQPDPLEYAQKKSELDVLEAQHNKGEIDLRYVDQSGFCLIPYVPYAWQEQGDQIEVPSSRNGKRLNVVGFLNRDNAFQAYTFECSVNSDVMIACIDEYCKQVTIPTVLVMDQASIHTSDAVTECLPRWQEQGVTVFYLPTYSPKLNRIEILWRFIKYYWLDFRAYESWKALVEQVEEILRMVGTKYIINFV
jgi:transposase